MENTAAQADRGEVAQLLTAARRGEGPAAARLYEVLYDDLRRIARARLRSHRTLTLLDTTALVHESFLRFANLGELNVEDRGHFLAYAARAMRSVIVDFVRQKQAARRGGGEVKLPLDTDLAPIEAGGEDEVLRVSEALDELAKVDARAAQVVELRYFGGLVDREIAQFLGVTERTVYRDWKKARLMLATALG
jgi:RNA polymerase sigma factor (TIGR02999 family)